MKEETRKYFRKIFALYVPSYDHLLLGIPAAQAFKIRQIG